jgi:hypothetical protein
MTNTLQRTLFGAIAVLFATATFEVSGALAQAQVNTGDVTSTGCGPGTITECGTENITKCSFNFDFQINPLTKGGGLSVGWRECQIVGVKKLYKDVTAATGSCGERTGPGSGPSGTSSRSGGHDDDADGAFCD